MEIGTNLDNQTLVERNSTSVSDSCIFLEEIDYDKEYKHLRFGCCPVLPIEPFFLYFVPPFGSIVVIVKYFEFLTLRRGILFISHILITLFCMASIFYSKYFCDKQTYDCDTFLNIGGLINFFFSFIAGIILICFFEKKL